MGALSIMIQDRQDLRWTVVSPECVRNHRGELGRLTGLDQDGPFAQQQSNGSGQDGEPIPPGVNLHRVGRAPGWRLRDAHLDDGDALWPGLPVE